MDTQQLQQLRDLPIEEVAQRLGLEVTRHKALCPFHNDHHPSLSFHRGRNTFRCFVCDAHGGTIDLAMRLLGKDFRDACRWLANDQLVHECKSSISHGSTLNREPLTVNREPLTVNHHPLTVNHQPLTVNREPLTVNREPLTVNHHPFDATRYTRFFEHPHIGPEACDFLFAQRRLDPRVIRWCRLTSWTDKHGIPWLQIPYFDPDGHLIGIQNRNLLSGSRVQISGVQEVQGVQGNQEVPRRGATHVVSPASLTSEVPITPDKRNGVTTERSNPISCRLGETPTQSPRLEETPPQPSNREPLTVNREPLTVNPAPRFRFPQGSRCSIYNLPVLRLLHEGEPLWIAEGASDCWALLSAGHKAIAIPSATLLTNEDKDILLSLSSSLSLNFHMAPDQDLPGEQLFLRLQALLPNLTRHQLPKGCKDYADYYVKFKIQNLKFNH